MERIREKLKKLEKFKYPLLILLIGIGILLLPGSSDKEAEDRADDENSLQTALTCTEGVGKVHVLVSEKGAVIVCEGAENAKTRLDIITAVRTYTGFSSDKITVLKMTDQILGG